MSDMQIGELYFVKEYFWLLFPTKELASRANRGTAEEAGLDAKILSERYKCNVSFFEPKTYVVLLEEAERFYKLLDSNGNIGWIYCHDFSKNFELVKE